MTTFPTNNSEEGYWKRIALASEQMAGGSTSEANESILGYMLRTAKAFEVIGPVSGGGGGGAFWGFIGGTLSNQTDLVTALAAKEPTVAPGAANQYWRGDKTWQLLDKTAVGLGSVDNTADAAKEVLSATKLTTARTINGVSFDGTGNITINAVDATARVPTTRAIATAAPLTGGGDLSADRTLGISAATTSAAGSMSAADKTKLDGVATGATSNSSDATLLNRANHTGTQAYTTITGLGTAATKNISVGTSAPASPATDDLWVDTN
jgi:hypothetical protein